MSDEDIKLVADRLNGLSSDYLPEPIFRAVARLSVLTAIEFIPLRRVGDNIEVLLFPRPDDDPHWRGALHTPGTILRPSDNSFDNAFTRLFTDELQTPVLPTLFLQNEFIKNNRGRLVTFEYIVDVSSVTSFNPEAVFYSVDSLPDTFLPEQQIMVRDALELFDKQHNTR